MKGMPATYLGRIVNKETFRTFIYNEKGEKKLVKSWNEFESHMELGVWFAIAPKEEIENKEENVSLEIAPELKPKRKTKLEKIKNLQGEPENDGVVME